MPKNNEAGERKGIWSAIVTPLNPDFTPDLERFRKFGTMQLDQGCDGLAILGTTGESSALAMQDRLALIQSACKSFGGDRLIVGVGCCALGDTVRLIEATLASGCREVLIMPPWLHPARDDGLFDYFRALVEAFPKSGLRIYLYHHPKLAGVAFSHDLTGRLIEKFPDHIIGIKDSSGDWSNMVRTLELFPGFVVLPGSESFLLQGLQKGAAGCISATFNQLAPLGVATMRAFLAGATTEAEAQQSRLHKLRQTIQAFPLIAANKFLLAHRLQDPEWNRVAPPQLVLTPAQEQELLEALGEWLDAQKMQNEVLATVGS